MINWSNIFDTVQELNDEPEECTMPRKSFKLVEFNQGRLFGCKADTVWLISFQYEQEQKWAYWDNERKCMTLTASTPYAAYYSKALAENAFNKIVEVYKQKHVTVLKEVVL